MRSSTAWSAGEAISKRGPIKGGNAEQIVYFYKLYFFQNSPVARFSDRRISQRPTRSQTKSEMRGGRSELLIRFLCVAGASRIDLWSVDPSSECLLNNAFRGTGQCCLPFFTCVNFLVSLLKSTALRQRQQGVRQRREQKGRQRTKVLH